jgi:hypothetical protein
MGNKRNTDKDDYGVRIISDWLNYID